MQDLIRAVLTIFLFILPVVGVLVSLVGLGRYVSGLSEDTGPPSRSSQDSQAVK